LEEGEEFIEVAFVFGVAEEAADFVVEAGAVAPALGAEVIEVGAVHADAAGAVGEAAEVEIEGGVLVEAGEGVKAVASAGDEDFEAGFAEGFAGGFEFGGSEER